MQIKIHGWYKGNEDKKMSFFIPGSFMKVRNRVFFSKIDIRKNIRPISSLLTRPASQSLPTVTIAIKSKLLSYHLSTQLKPSAVASRAQQFFSGFYKKIPFFRNFWVDTLDHYFSGPVKSVKTATLSQKVSANKEIWPIFFCFCFYTILAFHIV